jgi:hypothetical protein
MICKSLTATEGSVAIQQHFRMINACIHSHGSGTDTSIVDTQFYPVYSAMTGFIYFNAAIASCNNAYDTIVFQRAIKCFYQEDYMDDVDRIIGGFEPARECQVQYLPPSGIDLKSEHCKPEIIRECNITGTVKEWQPFWTYCKTLNAVYALHVGFQEYIYANIYCFMCNELYDVDKFVEITNKCSRLVDKISALDFSLTVILKPGFLFSDDNQIGIFTSSETSCPKNQIMVHSFTVRRK